MKKPANWAELTWEEKREKRFEWWRAAHGVNFIDVEAKAKHDRRLDRLIKAIKLEELPDRVPVDIAAGSFVAYYAGYTLKDIMFDTEIMREAWLKYGRDFDTDTMPMSGASSGLVDEILQTRSYKWPGGGLPDDYALIQFAEAEYMQEDDYDLYFKNPTDYILRHLLPRTYGVFEPLARLDPLDSFMGIGPQLMMAAGSPEFKTMAETLLKAHEASVAWGNVTMECERALREMGYPASWGALTLAPFDTIADMLRGTHGSVMDMFRRPEAIQELAERILPTNLESTIRMADMRDNPIVAIPMHKGDDMFMSDQQFEKFYWPTYRRLLLGLIEEGLVPQPIIDGTYNRRLDYIKDLPKSGVIWIFEKTDMAMAKKVLGGHTCIGGNVTGGMIYTKKPEDIRDYCRWLIDTCAPGGGYLLCLGSSLAGWNDPANIHAMIDTAKEYGVYR